MKTKTNPYIVEYVGDTFTLGLRAGITDRLELEVALPIRTVSYTSDPVIVAARAAGSLAGRNGARGWNLPSPVAWGIEETEKMNIDDCTIWMVRGLIEDLLRGQHSEAMRAEIRRVTGGDRFEFERMTLAQVRDVGRAGLHLAVHGTVA